MTSRTMPRWVWTLMATVSMLMTSLAPALGSVECQQMPCCGPTLESCCTAKGKPCECSLQGKPDRHDHSTVVLSGIKLKIDIPMLAPSRANWEWNNECFCQCQRSIPRNHGPPGDGVYRTDHGRAPPVG